MFYQNFIGTFIFKKTITTLHLILWIPTVRLATRFDKEVAINLALSINFILKDKVTTLSLLSRSMLVTSFFLGTEKFLNFSLFFPRHWNFPSDSFAHYLMIKW